MKVDDLKHSISVMFIHAMGRIETGHMTLDEFNHLVDLVGKVGPDDERQREFYDAVKQLAVKVDGVIASRIKSGSVDHET